MVLLPCDHLRGRVAGTTAGSRKGLPCCIGVGEPKIHYFDIVVNVKEEVFRFKVPMHDVKGVQILDTVNDLLEVTAGLNFFHSAFGHDEVKQLSSTSVLHDKI